MRNTGELQITLPELDDDWQWNVKIREHDYGIGPEPEMIISLEQGIWISSDGKEYAGSGYSSAPIALGRYKDYDELILDIQKDINGMYERWKYRDTEEKTVQDGIKHILEVFANNSLHLQTSNSQRLDYELMVSDDRDDEEAGR